MSNDKKEEFSPRELKLLEVLFDEACGNFREAMKLAGYSPNDPAGPLRKRLAKEIQDRSKELIVSGTPQAILNLLKIFDDPTYPGAKNIIATAKEILDRGGVNKEESTGTQNFEAKNIFILPAKDGD